MKQPTFVIGGAQRCGTTTLYDLLDQHPEIYLAKPRWPEPKFFVADPHPPKDRDWYLKTWFSGAPDVPALGEKSASYLETPGAAERMKAQFPAIKAIFILRHPVERAVSNYRYTRSHDLETESFDTAVRDEPRRLAETRFAGLSAHPHAYLRRGRYADDLEQFFEHFAAEDVKVVLNDDLAGDPATICRELFALLGVDDRFLPTRLDVRENVHPPDDLRMAPATLDHLFAYFAEPNQRLAAMLGRDLSDWDRPTPMLQSLLAR